MTRYEAAMATARALAYMEQKIDLLSWACYSRRHSYAGKLVQEFADELRLLG